MFLLNYLRRELWRRLRQTIVISASLAVAVGLVITATALTDGVRDARATAMRALYGSATDVVVTQPSAAGETNLSAFDAVAKVMQSGGATPGKPVSAEGLIGYGSADEMGGTGYGRIDAAAVGDIARIAGVEQVAGALTASNVKVELKTAGDPDDGDTRGWYEMGPVKVRPTAYQVGGIDVTALRLGPLASAKVLDGRGFETSDADAANAVVDAAFAEARGLRPGSSIGVGGSQFTVVGVLAQPAGARPADLYLPLGRAQTLSGMPNQINTVYLSTKGGADVAAVREQIRKLLPAATVTTEADLTEASSGSLNTATRVAGYVGTWLMVVVMLAAFALAGMLSLAATARRGREFGILKALGWQNPRVVGQVVAEGLVQGLIGAAAGIGIGFGAAALIERLAPSLSTTVGLPGTSSVEIFGGAESQFQQAIVASRTVDTITLGVPVTVPTVVLALSLALLGGLVAGAFGSWSAARQRPAVVLRRVH